MQILKVTDEAFRQYGKVIKDLDVSDIITAMSETPCPDDVVYEPSIESLEACKSAQSVSDSLYGGMPIQIGYCNGNNHKLNGLEYHRDSEVNIAVTDLILLIGSEQDIENGKYDTSKVEAFLVPAGTVIEVYATTLHYTPCMVDDGGFQVMVALPAGTNGPRPEAAADMPAAGDSYCYWKADKWVLCHADSPKAAEGGYVGLIGKNLDIACD